MRDHPAYQILKDRGNSAVASILGTMKIMSPPLDDDDRRMSLARLRAQLVIVSAWLEPDYEVVQRAYAAIDAQFGDKR